jgi:hypothetical protein
MDAFWNFFVQLGKWFGLAIAVLSIFFGFFVLGLTVGQGAFAVFWMLQVWIVGIWMGLMLIVLCQVAESKRP